MDILYIVHTLLLLYLLENITRFSEFSTILPLFSSLLFCHAEFMTLFLILLGLKQNPGCRSNSQVSNIHATTHWLQLRIRNIKCNQLSLLSFAIFLPNKYLCSMYIRDNFFTRVLTYLLPGVCINFLEHLEDFCWISFSSLKVKISEI